MKSFRKGLGILHKSRYTSWRDWVETEIRNPLTKKIYMKFFNVKGYKTFTRSLLIERRRKFVSFSASLVGNCKHHLRSGSKALSIRWVKPLTEFSSVMLSICLLNWFNMCQKSWKCTFPPLHGSCRGGKFAFDTRRWKEICHTPRSDVRRKIWWLMMQTCRWNKKLEREENQAIEKFKELGIVVLVAFTRCDLNMPSVERTREMKLNKLVVEIWWWRWESALNVGEKNLRCEDK